MKKSNCVIKNKIDGGFYNGLAGSVWGKKTDVRFGSVPSCNALGLAVALGLRPGWLSFRPGWMALRGGMDGLTNRRTDGKSPHSTGLCPLSGTLPKKRENEKNKFDSNNNASNKLLNFLEFS